MSALLGIASYCMSNMVDAYNVAQVGSLFSRLATINAELSLRRTVSPYALTAYVGILHAIVGIASLRLALVYTLLYVPLVYFIVNNERAVEVLQEKRDRVHASLRRLSLLYIGKYGVTAILDFMRLHVPAYEELGGPTEAASMADMVVILATLLAPGYQTLKALPVVYRLAEQVNTVLPGFMPRSNSVALMLANSRAARLVPFLFTEHDPDWVLSAQAMGAAEFVEDYDKEYRLRWGPKLAIASIPSLVLLHLVRKVWKSPSRSGGPGTPRVKHPPFSTSVSAREAFFEAKGKNKGKVKWRNTRRRKKGSKGKNVKYTSADSGSFQDWYNDEQVTCVDPYTGNKVQMELNSASFLEWQENIDNLLTMGHVVDHRITNERLGVSSNWFDWQDLPEYDLDDDYASYGREEGLIQYKKDTELRAKMIKALNAKKQEVAAVHESFAGIPKLKANHLNAYTLVCGTTTSTAIKTSTKLVFTKHALKGDELTFKGPDGELSVRKSAVRQLPGHAELVCIEVPNNAKLGPSSKLKVVSVPESERTGTVAVIGCYDGATVSQSAGACGPNGYNAYTEPGYCGSAVVLLSGSLRWAGIHLLGSRQPNEPNNAIWFTPEDVQALRSNNQLPFAFTGD